MNNDIISVIEQRLNCTVTNYKRIGKGASGCIYKVNINIEPYALAVKINEVPKLIIDEYNSINFISSKVDCKLPKLYFVENVNRKDILAMELIEGSALNRKALLFKKDKSKLANEIVDNLIKIHSVHNDKYGVVNNATYDSWYECYNDFAKDIVDFTNQSDVPKCVKKAVNQAYDMLFDIIGEYSGLPTLTHGDYWAPNILIDSKNMSLKGIIDPFNVSFTEPEYELFTLTVGCGKSLHLYEIYKSKVKTTKNCDVKVELYALFNELLWYKTLGKIDFGYLKYRSKRLMKMLDKVNQNDI